MVSWYAVLVLGVGLERLAELVVAKRNAAWSFARGGKEFGARHYPFIVALHTGLLAGCLFEVALAERPFVPAFGFPMLALIVAAQGLRWWCISTLGRQWNTRVIVVPNLPLVRRGPYRWRSLRHPNYVAVVVEGAALPLVHNAWITAIAFAVLNAFVLRARITAENAALRTSAASDEAVRV